MPDFLQQFIPEGDARNNLKFEADSDWDENEAGVGGDGAPGDAWGASAGGEGASGA